MYFEPAGYVTTSYTAMKLYHFRIEFLHSKAVGQYASLPKLVEFGPYLRLTWVPSLASDVVTNSRVFQFQGGALELDMGASCVWLGACARPISDGRPHPSRLHNPSTPRSFPRGTALQSSRRLVGVAQLLFLTCDLNPTLIAPRITSRSQPNHRGLISPVEAQTA
jgi:hypothetical protein